MGSKHRDQGDKRAPVPSMQLHQYSSKACPDQGRAWPRNSLGETT